MYKYNKLALLLVLSQIILSPLTTSAQERTYSPLSRYGYGELQNISYSGFGAMGHTGIALRSEYGINNLNPAAYTAMDSLSFYFDGGMSYVFQEFNNQGMKAQNSNILFDYIAMGFSVNSKVSAAFGFKPFTSMGYNYQELTEHDDNSTSFSNLTGSGSITEVYVGLAVVPIAHLSIGANISYLFGNVQNMAKATFSDANALKFGTYRQLNVSSVKFDFGAQYIINISDKKSVILGATFQPKIGLNGDQTLYEASGTVFGDNNNLFDPYYGSVDTISFNNEKFDADQYQIPAKIGLGASYNVQEKLKVGFDWTFENWTDINYNSNISDFNNTTKYSVGAEFIPKDRAATNYLNRIRYRMGGYYKNDYISLLSNDIYNYGITFGLGLPLSRSKTSINISMEYGERNTANSGNYKESYGKINVNFSLHEFWFVKRKFD